MQPAGEKPATLIHEDSHKVWSNRPSLAQLLNDGYSEKLSDGIYVESSMWNAVGAGY